ncbi:MAG: glycogen/starch synthase [Candidatus Lokiarchaeota archaeon]
MRDNSEKIWIFTFEYAGIAKAGGLGEVPANQAKNLKEYYDFTVFIPSHGQIKRLKNLYEFEKLPISYQGKLEKDNFEFIDEDYGFDVSYYLLNIDGIDIILIDSDKYLNDKTIYNPDTFEAKLCLYSLSVKYYTQYIIETQKEKLPTVIHLHDYHVVIPFIALKQELHKNDLNVGSLITIHLLTWPRYELDFYQKCGVDNSKISVRTKNGIIDRSLNEIFTICSEVESKPQPPTVERIGAFVSDIVITVSKSYLESDIIPSLGGKLIEFKSNFVWNGCDWDYNEMKKSVIDKFGEDIREYLKIPQNSKISLENMKEYLLTYKIGNLDKSPLINSTKVLDAINLISNGNEFIRNGKIKSFKDSGPLLITTGRISAQKGFEIILESIPEIIKVVPNAKILLLLLPNEYSINQIKEYAEYVKKYSENLRIIFGVAAEIFNLAHIAADVYAALSRWEPFGIIALEAMASKLPVIATKVGGLQESVIDIKEDPERGTGLLIKKDSKEQFAKSLVSMFYLSEISESKNSDKFNNLDNFRIPIESIREITESDPNYYNKLRENCYNRVNNYFRWAQVSKKLIELYNKVKGLYE